MNYRRRSPLFFLVLCFVCLTVRAQDPNPIIEQMVNGVSLDSLVHHLRILTGVDSVSFSSTNYLIETRKPFTTGNHFAAHYLKRELDRRTLVEVHTFDHKCEPGSPCLQGVNVLGILPLSDGSVSKDAGPLYILSAHYDSYAGSLLAPGADDNASGTAAVLEAARVIDKALEAEGRHHLKVPIVFALWDVEEYGLHGSTAYANQAFTNGSEILGVVNLDMLGYDGDGDRDFWIIGSSIHPEFSQTFIPLNDLYGIGLGDGTIRWGGCCSDHRSFVRVGYPAVTLSEGWWTGDRHPDYHSPGDTLGHFNLDTYLRMTKLAVTAIAHLALGGAIGTNIGLSTGEIPDQIRLGQNHPNPFNSSTTITYSLPRPSIVRLEVFDLLGRRAGLLERGLKSIGEHEVIFDATDLLSGIYFYTLTAGDFSQTRKMVLLR